MIRSMFVKMPIFSPHCAAGKTKSAIDTISIMNTSWHKKKPRLCQELLNLGQIW